MTALDALKATRREIAAKLDATMKVQARVREAANGESAALAAIGALGAKEVEAVQAWAVAGAEGPMPEFDAAERRRLAEALASAQMRALAAQGALSGFDATERDLSTELQSVNAQIDDLALDDLAARHADEVANIAAVVKTHVIPKIARAFALHAFLVEKGQAHIGSGRTETGTAYLRRAEAIGRAMPALELEPTRGDVIAKMTTWSTRFDALVSDPKPGTGDNVVSLQTEAA